MITETKKYLQVKDLNENLTKEDLLNCFYHFNDDDSAMGVYVPNIINSGNLDRLIEQFKITISQNYEGKFKDFKPEHKLTNNDLEFLLENNYYGYEALDYLANNKSYDISNYENLCKDYNLNNCLFGIELYYQLKECVKAHEPMGFFANLNDVDRNSVNEYTSNKDIYESSKDGIDKLIEFINDKSLNWEQIVDEFSEHWKGFLYKEEKLQAEKEYKADMEESIKEKMPVNSIKYLLENLEDDSSLWGMKVKSNILYNINNNKER